MGTDLSRVGLADSGAFEALSDSVLSDMSGGTGRADGPPAKEVGAHVDRVNRLIATYDALMSGAKR